MNCPKVTSSARPHSRRTGIARRPLPPAERQPRLRRIAVTHLAPVPRQTAAQPVPGQPHPTPRPRPVEFGALAHLEWLGPQQDRLTGPLLTDLRDNDLPETGPLPAVVPAGVAVQEFALPSSHRTAPNVPKPVPVE